VRRCSRCHRTDHNVRTCKVELNPELKLDIRPISKELELGHKILAEQRKIVEREEINGVLPNAGYWIISPKRKKIAGKISSVKRNGEIVWKSSLGAVMTTKQSLFSQSDYCYVTDLEPEMLRWNII
jgi:hypothetical protein